MSDAETPWDEEAAYDERIFPLMKQILDICKQREIPMFATFAYKNDHEDGANFCTSMQTYPHRRVPEIDKCYGAVMATAQPALRMTTKDSAGNVVRDEVVFP